MVDYRNIFGHIEVYISGIFFASADNMSEAHSIVLEEYGND